MKNMTVIQEKFLKVGDRWDLKYETLKYLQDDQYCLIEILNSFYKGEPIKDMYSIYALESYSLPSLGRKTQKKILSPST